MSITTSVCTSWIRESALGLHQTDDEYRAALVRPGSRRIIDETFTNYDDLGDDEVLPIAGYVARGAAVGKMKAANSAGIVTAGFDDALWPAASFSASGAVIFNATRGGRTVCVLSFGSVAAGGGGEFRVPLGAVLSAAQA